MNLFQDLEGLSGEVLGSAALRHLILRSLPLRDETLKALSSKSPIGPLVSHSHFSCYLEHPTEDEDGNAGRLDLVLELDGAVVGIESKFFAAFTEGQPGKYLSSLARLARTLSEVRRREVRHALFVLAPASRKSEIESHVRDLEGTRFVSWEEILGTLTAAATQADEVTRTLALEFAYFIRQRVAFMPNLEQLLPHLKAKFEPKGSEYHVEFLQALAAAFPGDPPRMNRGHDWCGYYLHKDPADDQVWLGFQPATRETKGRPETSSMILAADKDLPMDPRIFAPVSMSKPIEFRRLSGKYTHAKNHWRMNLDLSLAEHTTVAAAFAPAFDSPHGNRPDGAAPGT